MAESDDEIRKLFAHLKEVPFTDTLQKRIAEGLTRHDAAPVRGLFRGKSAFAGAAGLTAACLLVYAVWNYSSPSVSVTPSSPVRTPLKRSIALPRQTSTDPLAFGLQAAPLSIGDIWVGGSNRSSPKTNVYATLTNVGTVPTDPYRVVGVLSFQKHNTANLLQSTDWITFVDPPKARLTPGSSTTWSFRPVGAPHAADGTLTERPRLAFFTSGLVPNAKADTLWKIPSVRVDQLVVEPRKQWQQSQSIEVRARFKNLERRPIRLKDLLAVVWFSANRSTDWTQPGIVRFMDQVQPVEQGVATVAPNHSVDVYFRLIGSEKTNFLGLVPQVAFIEP